MTKTTDKPALPRKTGMTHGVRAFVDSGKLPSGRLYRRAMKEVSATRERLITKYGGDKIEPDVLAMVDTAAKAMMIQELCTIYIKRAGVMRKDSLNAGNLELHSVLAKSYASYANLVRLSLEAAARLADRKPSDAGVEDVLAYAARVYPEDKPPAQGAAETGPVVPQDGRSPEDEANDADISDTPTGGEINDKGDNDNGRQV